MGEEGTWGDPRQPLSPQGLARLAPAAGWAALAAASIGLAAQSFSALLVPPLAPPVWSGALVCVAGFVSVWTTIAQMRLGLSAPVRVMEFVIVVAAAFVLVNVGLSLNPPDPLPTMLVGGLGVVPAAFAWLAGTYVTMPLPRILDPVGAGEIAAETPWWYVDIRMRSEVRPQRGTDSDTVEDAPLKAQLAERRAQMASWRAARLAAFVVSAWFIGSIVRVPGIASAPGAFAVVGCLVGLAGYTGQVRLIAREIAWKTGPVAVSGGITSGWSGAILYGLAAAVLAASLIPADLSPLAHVRWGAVFEGSMNAVLAVLQRGFRDGFQATIDTVGQGQDGTSGGPAPMGGLPGGGGIFELVWSTLFLLVPIIFLIWGAIRMMKLLRGGQLSIRDIRIFLHTLLTWPAIVWRLIVRRLLRGRKARRAIALGGSERAAEANKRRFRRIRRAFEPSAYIRHLFRLLLRRAQRRGLARRSWETASEYASGLRKTVPDADAEIDSLVDAYVVARYRQTGVEPNVVEQARRWIRTVLRRLPRARQAREEEQP